MIRSPVELRQAEHDRLAEQVSAFLARGGRVEVVPRGVSGDTLTPRQRINPPVMREERAAKRAVEKAIVPTRRPKEPRPPAPKKLRVRNGPEFAQPTSQKGQILALLRTEPLRSDQIAERLGIKPTCVRANLHVLGRRGEVSASGPGKALVYTACR